METGMTNLGSGGEAKASPADREAAETDLGQSSETGGVPNAAGRGGSMDAAMGANMDPSRPADGITLEQGRIAGTPSQAGGDQTAAYGETVDNVAALEDEG